MTHTNQPSEGEKAQPSDEPELCFCDRMYPDSNPDASCGGCPTRDYRRQEKAAPSDPPLKRVFELREDGWILRGDLSDPFALKAGDIWTLYSAPASAPAVPELTSTVINDACWKFVEAMPHNLPGPIFNDLKPALYAAVCHVLAAPTPPASVQQPAPYVNTPAPDVDIAGQAAPSDDEIEALAKKHVATGADQLRAICPDMPPYQQTEQFRRVKAMIKEVLARHGGQPAESVEPVALSQYGYQALFNAISAATWTTADGSIEVSVQAFRDALKDAPVAAQAPAIQWPVMPPSTGQSPVLFEDGYAEGWAKCLDECQKAAAAAQPSAPAYTSAMGEAAESYIARVAPDAHRLPMTVRWPDLYEAMLDAAQASGQADPWTLFKALHRIAAWPDGGEHYGQEKIKRFAQDTIDAAQASGQAQDAAILKGHSSLAEMIVGHTHVWRSALEYCQKSSTRGSDVSYYTHELLALTDIERAVNAARAAGGEHG